MSGRGGRCLLGTHDTAGRRRILAIASRCGAYNYLNIMLLGVLQLLCKKMAGAPAGNGGRPRRRATAEGVVPTLL